MNTDNTDLQIQNGPALFDPCKSVLSVVRFFAFSDPRLSALISGKLLLFESSLIRVISVIRGRFGVLAKCS
jgi:hypothetical protein